MMIAAATMGAAFVAATALSSSAQAVVPPESCFQFTPSTGTIEEYHRHQNNVTSQPLCPADVDIPSTIGGVSVTTIGDYAFSGNRLQDVVTLTSVTIPTTVTAIEQYAFSRNELQAVVLPSGLTQLGSEAFAQNQIETLTIPPLLNEIPAGAFLRNKLSTLSLPSSVTTVGDYAFGGNRLSSLTLNEGLTTLGIESFSGNFLTAVDVPASLSVIQSSAFSLNHPTMHYDDVLSGAIAGADYYATMQYVRLYSTQSSTPTTLESDALIIDEQAFNFDFNNDGDTNDIVNAGGYLMNPASLTISQVDQAGNSLATDVIRTATLNGGAYATSYRPEAGPSVPTAQDPYNPTAAERSAQAAALAAYYRQGATLSVAAPEVSGYEVVSPTSPHSFTLSSASNQLEFTYQQTATSTPSPTQPDSSPQAGEDSDDSAANQATAGAPNTGEGRSAQAQISSTAVIALLTVVALTIASVVGLVVHARKHRRL